MIAPDRPEARTIAAAVSGGSISARDNAAAMLARLEAYDSVQPQAWIARFPAAAILAAAGRVDARILAGETLPLAGVPFAVKDNIDVAGLPTTAGCPAIAYTPDRSATMVERLLAAGAICVGKTNLDQFATGLVGTRSPHGAPRCVYNLDYVSGGSSSGSAVAVAAGLVAFALGTDTAGSGRVPAAFNHLVGLKPTRGRWSAGGLIPACRSLDCITVLANTVADAALVDAVVAGFDADDAYSRRTQDRPRAGRRIGVPRPEQLVWFGDGESARLYDRAVEALATVADTIVPVDIAPLLAAARLLYDGPWVAERTAALDAFPGLSPADMDPVVAAIIDGGRAVTGAQTFAGLHALAGHARAAEALWETVDLLALPTAPTIYRVAEVAAAPIALNAHLGLYTNFVNLLDMAAIAVPAGFRRNATGFGITLIGPAWTDGALMAVAEDYLSAMAPIAIPPLATESSMETVQLAVVGAHLCDMPLHWQLTSRDARFVRAARTAPSYRLFAMANSTPPKPALVHAGDGAAIELEIYELDVAAFGSFVAEVPAPLAIGTVTLDDGSAVKGFVAEPRAITGADDITLFGGWRAYIASLAG